MSRYSHCCKCGERMVFLAGGPEPDGFVCPRCGHYEDPGRNFYQEHQGQARKESLIVAKLRGLFR